MNLYLSIGTEKEVKSKPRSNLWMAVAAAALLGWAPGCDREQPPTAERGCAGGKCDEDVDPSQSDAAPPPVCDDYWKSDGYCDRGFCSFEGEEEYDCTPCDGKSLGDSCFSSSFSDVAGFCEDEGDCACDRWGSCVPPAFLRAENGFSGRGCPDAVTEEIETALTDEFYAEFHDDEESALAYFAAEPERFETVMGCYEVTGSNGRAHQLLGEACGGLHKWEVLVCRYDLEGCVGEQLYDTGRGHLPGRDVVLHERYLEVADKCCEYGIGGASLRHCEP